MFATSSLAPAYLAIVAHTLLYHHATAAPLSPRGISPKHGLTYNEPKLLPPWAGKVSFVINWEQDGTNVPDGMAYYPMLWNGEKQRVDRWETTASAALARGDKVLFSFNEPMLSLCPDAIPAPPQFQACMTPEHAAAVWKAQMAPWAAKGATLVAPAIKQGDEGMNWLKEFLRACPEEECHIAGLNLHWYEKHTKLDDLQATVKSAYEDDEIALGAGGKRRSIWLTEFAPTDGTDAEKADFFKRARGWLDQQEFVAGYAAFWAETMGTADSINAVGAGYV